MLVVRVDGRKEERDLGWVQEGERSESNRNRSFNLDSRGNSLCVALLTSLFPLSLPSFTFFYLT